MSLGSGRRPAGQASLHLAQAHEDELFRETEEDGVWHKARGENEAMNGARPMDELTGNRLLIIEGEDVG